MDSTDASPSDPGPDVERAKSGMQQLEAQLDQDANVTGLGLTRADDGRIAILVLVHDLEMSALPAAVNGIEVCSRLAGGPAVAYSRTSASNARAGLSPYTTCLGLRRHVGEAVRSRGCTRAAVADS